MLARRRQIEEEDDINMTPMMDIVFIMLIFFIVTASFVKEAGVEINRPTAATAETKARASILIAITAENEIWMDKRKIDIRTVQPNIERMRAENPKGSVVVQADAQSKNGILVKVVDAAKLAGVENVAVSAKPE